MNEKENSLSPFSTTTFSPGFRSPSTFMKDLSKEENLFIQNNNNNNNNKCEKQVNGENLKNILQTFRNNNENILKDVTNNIDNVVVVKKLFNNDKNENNDDDDDNISPPLSPIMTPIDEESIIMKEEEDNVLELNNIDIFEHKYVNTNDINNVLAEADELLESINNFEKDASNFVSKSSNSIWNLKTASTLKASDGFSPPQIVKTKSLSINNNNNNTMNATTSNIMINDNCEHCINLRNQIININEDQLEWQNRYEAIREEGLQLFETFESKCARLNEISNANVRVQSMCHDLEQENKALEDDYMKIYNAYKDYVTKTKARENILQGQVELFENLESENKRLLRENQHLKSKMRIKPSIREQTLEKERNDLIKSNKKLSEDLRMMYKKIHRDQSHIKLISEEKYAKKYDCILKRCHTFSAQLAHVLNQIDDEEIVQTLQSLFDEQLKNVPLPIEESTEVQRIRKEIQEYTLSMFSPKPKLEETIRKQQQQIHELEMKLTQLKLSNVKEQSSIGIQTIDDGIKNQLNELNQEVENQLLLMTKLEAKNKRIQNEKQILIKENEKLMIDYQQLQTFLNDENLAANEAAEELENELNELKLKINDKNSTNVDELKEELLNQQQSFNDIQTQFDMVKTAYNSKINEYNTLKNNNDNIYKNLEDLKEKYEEIQNKLKSQEEKLTSTLKKYNDIQPKYKKSQNKLHESILEIEFLQEQINKTNISQNQELNELINENTTLKHEINESKQYINNLKEKLNHTTQSLEKLQNEYQSVQEHLKHKIDEIYQLRQHILQLEKTQRETERQHAEKYSDFQSKFAKCEGKMAAIENERDRLQIEREKMKEYCIQYKQNADAKVKFYHNMCQSLENLAYNYDQNLKYVNEIIEENRFTLNQLNIPNITTLINKKLIPDETLATLAKRLNNKN